MFGVANVGREDASDYFFEPVIYPFGEDFGHAVDGADDGSGTASGFVDFVGSIKLRYPRLIQMFAGDGSIKVDGFCLRDKVIFMFFIDGCEPFSLCSEFITGLLVWQEFIVEGVEQVFLEDIWDIVASGGDAGSQVFVCGEYYEVVTGSQFAHCVPLWWRQVVPARSRQSSLEFVYFRVELGKSGFYVVFGFSRLPFAWYVKLRYVAGVCFRFRVDGVGFVGVFIEEGEVEPDGPLEFADRVI